MSYYDPWTHAMQIFLTRLVQFIALSIALGLSAWSGLLHWYFDSAWFETTKLAVTGGNASARVMLALCLGNGAFVTAWLFTWLMLRRPHAGDRHHRGARVVHHDDE